MHFINIVSRLDMENTVLAQPETTDNQCQSDQFIVSGGTPVPALCGTLTGSHSKILNASLNCLSLISLAVYIDMKSCLLLEHRVACWPSFCNNGLVNAKRQTHRQAMRFKVE